MGNLVQNSRKQMKLGHGKA